MKKLIHKDHITSICFIFLLYVFLTGCNSTNPDKMTADKYYIQIDDSVYLNSFPSEVYLELGKSILIENSGTAFRFIDILEYDEYNSSVLLQVEYSTGKLKTIVLNTGDSYPIGNGYNHMIQLKELNQTNYTYRIILIYKEYFRL